MMTPDIAMLSVLMSRKDYNRYGTILRNLRNADRNYKAILSIIESYYERFTDAEHISNDDLELYFATQNPAYKDKEIIDETFKQMLDADVNPELIRDTLNKVVEKHYAARMVAEAMPVSEGVEHGKLPELRDVIDQYETIAVARPEEDDRQKSLEELLKSVETTGLKWRLDYFNQTLGSIRGGSLGHVFAYSETGKTALAVSESTYFAQQIMGDGAILYLANEESVDLTHLRAYCALLGTDRTWVENNRDKAKELWALNGGNSIRFYDNVDHIRVVESRI